MSNFSVDFGESMNYTVLNTEPKSQWVETCLETENIKEQEENNSFKMCGCDVEKRKTIVTGDGYRAI